MIVAVHHQPRKEGEVDSEEEAEKDAGSDAEEEEAISDAEEEEEEVVSDSSDDEEEEEEEVVSESSDDEEDEGKEEEAVTGIKRSLEQCDGEDCAAAPLQQVITVYELCCCFLLCIV